MKREKDFLILISRLSFKKEDKTAIEKLVREDLDWFYILAQSFRHKITGLLWLNMNELNLSGYIPRAVSEPMEFYSFVSSERYKVMENESNLVATELKKRGCLCFPLKGAFLIPDIYGDGRRRISNDIDFLIQKKDAFSILKIMESLGYEIGEFDPFTRKVVGYSREKRILWMRAMDNLPAFYKQMDCPYLDYMVIDFRHSINNNSDIVDRIFYKSSDGKMDLISFYLHLCYHTHDEAVQYNAHNMLKDLTLMKFCDVREFALKYIAEQYWDDVVDIAAEYELEDSLHFCLKALSVIYNDGYEKNVLAKLGVGVDDDSILETYGIKEYGKMLTFQKGFMERLFSFNNKSEIKRKPDWALL